MLDRLITMIMLQYMFLCMNKLNYGKCPYEVEVYNRGEEGGA